MTTKITKTVLKKPQEATALLRADHALVAKLYTEYEASRSNNKKKEIVARMFTELTIHAQVEDEIFYPAFQNAIRDKLLVPEAAVEHATLKDLIAQVEGAEPDGEMFDAKIIVLSEYVKHHVKEERNEMFPKAKASKLDLFDMGVKIAQRKEVLLAEHADATSSAGAVTQRSAA